ncbi:unnamed protein product [Calypogeia fissa]
MDSGPSQDSRAVEYPYRNTYAQRVQPKNSSLDNTMKFESDSPILDETIEIVKDKVWSFRSALKAAAEALVNFGLPPQVVGYESVPLGEDEKLAQKNDAEVALRKVAEDEMLARSSSSKSKENSWQHGTGEGSSLVDRPDDMDDTNHAFAEAVRKEKEERKSLTRTLEFDEDEEDGRSK